MKAIPILESYGVDLILSGHSHTYERSRLINGHHGFSSTFDAASMALDTGNGSEVGRVLEDGTFVSDGGDGGYMKPAATPNAGFVATVVGCSGEASRWTTGSTRITNPTPHPVMVVSLRVEGSLSLEIDGDRLEGNFIDASGAVRDHFSLTKGSTLNVEAASAGSPPVFEINRTGATEFPLSVAYEWSEVGGNQNGEGTVSFASGEGTKTVSIGGLAAGTDGVTLNLTKSADYRFGDRSTATVSGGTVRANTPPEVSLLSPDRSSNVTIGQPATLIAQASDADGSLASVSFYVGEELVCEEASAPFECQWTPQSPGRYALTAVARDHLGARTTSLAVDVEVNHPAYLPEAGTIVIEAENRVFEVSRADHQWEKRTDVSGFVGSAALSAGPNVSFSVPSDPEGASPEVGYTIFFNEPGEYRLWSRGFAAGNGDDSFHVGINGVSQVKGSVTVGSWGWKSKSISIPGTGYHTLNIWMREDGCYLDRFVLTNDSTVPTGDGPPETSRDIETTQVDLSVVDAEAAEARIDSGLFRISRSGSLANALIVRLSVGGTAQPGKDYDSLPRQVSIPAGSSHVDLLLNPIDDSVTEVSESVDLRLLAGSGYVLGSAIGSVVIEDDDLPGNGFSSVVVSPSEPSIKGLVGTGILLEAAAPGATSVDWSVESGDPSGLLFADRGSLETTVTFLRAGGYTVRLSVSDGSEMIDRTIEFDVVEEDAVSVLEVNGEVVLEAEAYSVQTVGGGFEWSPLANVPEVGGESMTVFATWAEEVGPGEGPRLDYPVR
ncbi:MAG: Ig-like domain-containing protein, partial [Verrucomicrobiota bacterium]